MNPFTPYLIAGAACAVIAVAAAVVYFWLLRRRRNTTTPGVSTGPAWTDPLDPHGDGTLRRGDPVFDAMMRGNAVMGNFGSDGWKFSEFPPKEESS